MESKLTNTKPGRRSAFTLVEMMVTTAIASILMIFAASFYLFSLRSFSTMANYMDLNNRSRNASDMISRDLRSALSVQSLAANRLVLNEPNGQNATYTYDASRGLLTRSDGTHSQVLLTGIAPSTFGFSFYGRSTNASPTYESFPTNAPNGAKLVGFKWSCSRPGAAGSPGSTEGIQMAIVNLRNQ